jgi:hypothetical protein
VWRNKISRYKSRNFLATHEIWALSHREKATTKTSHRFGREKTGDGYASQAAAKRLSNNPTNGSRRV